MMTPARWSIRRATDADRMVRREIIGAAWHAAYTHIFTPDEINALFHGRVQQTSSWEDLRCERLPGVVADSNDGIVGTAGLARWRDGAGELVSLYIRPADQGQGIGRALWVASAAILRAHGCPSLNVWVLERAPAVHFYEHCGGILVQSGTYRVGDHHEPARRYRVPL